MKTLDDVKEKVEELEDEIATIDKQLRVLDREYTKAPTAKLTQAIKTLNVLRRTYLERKYMLNWVLG